MTELLQRYDRNMTEIWQQKFKISLNSSTHVYQFEKLDRCKILDLFKKLQ